MGALTAIWVRLPLLSAEVLRLRIAQHRGELGVSTITAPKF